MTKYKLKPFSFRLSVISFLLQEHKIREKFVEAMEKEFADMGLKFSIGTNDALYLY